MFRLEYLPKAQQDIIEISKYIAHDLANPNAAERIISKIVKAIDKLVTFPYIHRVYQPVKPLNQEYRRLIVENYLIFYWIDEEQKHITVARIIYARQDYEKHL